MALSIRNFLPTTNYGTYTDLQPAFECQEIAVKIDGLAKTYYTINVSQAMSDLAQVGGLLRVANAASKGYSCNKPVLNILGTYQTIVGNSYQASSVFVQRSLEALNKHIMALRAVKKEKAPIAIKQIGQCEKMATEMAVKSGELADAVGRLAAESLKAMEMASENQSTSEDRRREVQKMIADFKAEEEKQKSLATDLAEATQRAREHEQKMMAKADQARKDKMTLAIVQACAGAVGNVAGAAVSIYSGKNAGGNVNSDQGDSGKGKSGGLSQGIGKYQNEKSAIIKELQEAELELAKKEVELKHLDKEKDKDKILTCEQEIAVLTLKVKQKKEESATITSNIQPLQDVVNSEAATLESLEAKATELRYQLEGEQRQANSKLKEAAEKLKGLSVEQDDLKTAFQSLDVAIQTMGKVKTVFENVRLFWTGVAANCKAMTEYSSDLKDLNEMEDFEGIEMIINQSALSWMTLCKMNYTAQTSIASVKDKVDLVMRNLPDPEEARRIVSEFSPDNLIEEVL